MSRAAKAPLKFSIEDAELSQILQSLITGQIAANALKDKTGWPRQEDIEVMAKAEETIYRIHNDDARIVATG